MIDIVLFQPSDFFYVESKLHNLVNGDKIEIFETYTVSS